MPIVHLEFDLDSDVYPELHAVLAGMGSAAARGERIRALAAAGLVWENVRVYGASAIGPSVNAPTAQASAAAPSPASAPLARSAPAPKAERTPSEKKAGARTRAATPARAAQSDPRGADFVDLAINAQPEAPGDAPDGLDTAQQIAREAEQVARELPVLMDVVADSEVISDAVEARTAPTLLPPPPSLAAAPPVLSDAVPAAVPSPLPAQALPPSAAHAVYELPRPVVEHSGGDTGAHDDAIHVTALAQKPATRSRLMRMKDKGLFKNG